MSAPTLSWPSTNCHGIELVDPVTVTVEGNVLLLARQAATPVTTLYYNVRASGQQMGEASQWTGWRPLSMTEPSHNTTPDVPSADDDPLLRLAGMTLITVGPVAISPHPADAAFRVVTDGRYVCCVRSSTSGSLYVDRFILVPQPVTSGQARAGDAPAFVLERIWETRYRRSEVRDVPAGTGDALGSSNMVDEPFLEPTVEVMPFSQMTADAFDVALTPTGSGSWRWQFASVTATGVECVSYPQDSAGRIDVSPSTASRFTLTPTVSVASTPSALTPYGGVALATFEEQERAAMPDGTAGSLRRGVRLGLAVPVRSGTLGLPGALAVYDFAVKPGGLVPALPVGSLSVLIDGTLSGGHFTPTPSASGYPVPAEAIYTVGDVTVAAVLLGQPQPSGGPMLLNSADGLLHCYFGGPADSGGNNPFLVAQLDPTVTRAAAALSWTASGGQAGQMELVARRAGTTFNGLSITVSDCAGNPDLCTVVIDYGATSGVPTETWNGLPRDVSTLARILNGQSAGDPSDPAVQAGAVPFYDLAGALTMARLTTTGGTVTVPLTLTSHRPDVKLSTVTVANGATGQVTVTTTYSLPGGGTATQTWPALPAAVPSLVPVLDGTASRSVYPYVPPATDVPCYALATDAGGSILLFAKVAGSVQSLTVTSATDGDPLHCDIVVQPATGSPIRLPSVSRGQSSVLTALRGNSAVTALFAYISPDPVPGTVVDQAESSALDLRGSSTLFDVVRPAGDGRVAPGTANAVALQGRTSPSPVTGGGRGMFALTARNRTMPPLGESAVLGNSVSTLSQTGANGAWMTAHVPSALTFDESNAMTVSSPNAQLSPGRTTTVEAWVCPVDGTPSRALHYNAGKAKELGAVTPAYLLGTLGMSTLQYASFAPSGPYAGSYINVTAYPDFGPASTTGFTWEAWIRPDAAYQSTGNAFACVLQAQDTVVPDVAQCQLGLSADLHLTFGYRTGDPGNATLGTVTAPTPLTLGTWTHVAVTGSVTGQSCDVRIYVDGLPVMSATTVTLYEATEAPFVCIGANDLVSVSLFGALGEVRYWSYARTTVELRRTMNTSLHGTEPGLVGYWPLNEDPAAGTFANQAAVTGSLLNGTLKASSTQAVTSSSDGEFVNIIAAVGGAAPVLARGFMRANHWNHLAVVHEAAGGLWLNRSGLTAEVPDYGVCTDASSLQIGEQASIEAWVQIAKPTTLGQTILAQWGVQQTDQAYQLAVGVDGRPCLSVTVADVVSGSTIPIAASGATAVTDGVPHHITATYSSTTTGTNSVECTLVVYVDGVAGPVTTHTVSGTPTALVVASKQPVTLGISALATASTGTVALELQAPFQGLLTGVRFWAVAMTAAQVLAAMAGQRDYDGTAGMTSAWWFTDDTGASAEDSVSDNDIILSDTDMWASFASISRTTCYGNGIPIGLVTAAPTSATGGYPTGDVQCTLGAYAHAGSYIDSLDGSLAEVRVWSSARSWAQVVDTMYRPLSGGEPELRAYWRLDGDTSDATGRGSTGTLVGNPAPTFTPSSAPVANEGPQVRNVYAGPRTDFQQPLTGRASVIEYAESDVHADGVPAAVMRRAYVACNPRLAVFTGYGLGEMTLTYLGQVQTNPSLIGFIEGAPPVPSENLSRPLYASALGYNSYIDASTVRLDVGAATSMTFSSSDYRTSLDMNLETKVGITGQWSTQILFTLANTAFSIFKGKAKATVHHKSALSQATQHDESYVSAWTRTVSDSLGLRGAWETPPNFLNTDVGRRYNPHNQGYALVESLTADLYAMRLRSTGAMVGKIVIPDLEIPPDRNVLMFKIRPEYVKNGTLDGKIGLVNDPHYPLADTERGSYFKPREAYRLAASIEATDTKLQTYYDQLRVQSRGQQGPGAPSLDEQAGKQFYDFAAGAPSRGIANRYVWTAVGGLHTETESFSSTHESSYNGSYDYTHATGFAGEVEFDMPVGPYGNIDLLFGGQIKISVAKTQVDTHTVTLTVTDTCDPMLQAYVPSMNAGPGVYTDTACPGKVDAYRFMSFYLPQSVDNYKAFFSDVVDKEWLTFSSDPNAIALRGLSSDDSGVWRVLHRVTYVSRIPPKFDSNPDQTVAPAPVLAIDTADNAMLISLVQQALGSGAPSPSDVGGAVAKVLAPSDGTTPSMLGVLVPWWAAFLAKARGGDAAATALLDEILGNAMRYFQAGYSGGVLPLRTSV